VLSRIESVTGKSIAELFDLIAGTSTGGILALALTKPGPDGKPALPARDLVALYEEEGERIFHRDAWRRMRALGNLAEGKYLAGGIEAVIEQYFGESRLKDAVTAVLVTSYETERRLPFFFRSSRALTRPDYDFPMKFVARATSAAPTYFEPLKLATDGPADYYSLIDGGVYANNPAMCAFVEAKTLYPDAEEFLVASLGTGELTRALRFDDVKDWGLAKWAKPILDVVFDGVSCTVDYQLRQLLTPVSDGQRRYWRFQVRLDEKTCSMDDARPENIRRLKLFAEQMIRDRSEDLRALCRVLRD
jgi:patatin-like phospholipase/acyl hydrolase